MDLSWPLRGITTLAARLVSVQRRQFRDHIEPIQESRVPFKAGVHRLACRCQIKKGKRPSTTRITLIGSGTEAP